MQTLAQLNNTTASFNITKSNGSTVSAPTPLRLADVLKNGSATNGGSERDKTHLRAAAFRHAYNILTGGDTTKLYCDKAVARGAYQRGELAFNAESGDFTGFTGNIIVLNDYAHNFIANELATAFAENGTANATMQAGDYALTISIRKAGEKLLPTIAPTINTSDFSPIADSEAGLNTIADITPIAADIQPDFSEHNEPTKPTNKKPKLKQTKKLADSEIAF